jgi:hypothetical protein
MERSKKESKNPIGMYKKSNSSTHDLPDQYSVYASLDFITLQNLEVTIL